MGFAFLVAGEMGADVANEFFEAYGGGIHGMLVPRSPLVSRRTTWISSAKGIRQVTADWCPPSSIVFHLPRKKHHPFHRIGAIRFDFFKPQRPIELDRRLHGSSVSRLLSRNGGCLRVHSYPSTFATSARTWVKNATGSRIVSQGYALRNAASFIKSSKPLSRVTRNGA